MNMNILRNWWLSKPKGFFSILLYCLITLWHLVKAAFLLWYATCWFEKPWKKRVIHVIVSILIICGIRISIDIIYIYTTSRSLVVTVTGKDREVYKDKPGARYVVYTIRTQDSQSEIFENKDCWLPPFFKTRASDMQALFQIGSKYRVTVYGYRSGFLTKYRNIGRAEYLEGQ
jgi:hypothetical protein